MLKVLKWLGIALIAFCWWLTATALIMKLNRVPASEFGEGSPPVIGAIIVLVMLMLWRNNTKKRDIIPGPVPKPEQEPPFAPPPPVNIMLD